jgi:hypothetical protein
MEVHRNAFRILARRPGGRMPLGRPRHRWEYNKTIHFGENKTGLLKVPKSCALEIPGICITA